MISQRYGISVEELIKVNCIDTTYAPPPSYPANTVLPLYVPNLAAIPIPEILITPNPTLALQTAFVEVDKQFEDSIKSNIVFTAPESMKLEETIIIELLLNPSRSKEALATEIVDFGNLATSTSEPGQLVTHQGEPVTVLSSEIQITDRMKAVLKSPEEDAFVIQDLHDNAVQPISSINTTRWRWSVTAKKEGIKTLELNISRLIKKADQEYWVEVKSYSANIVVNVTPVQRIKSLDWKWITGFILAVIGSVLGILNWLVNRNKKAEEKKPIHGSKKRKK